MSPQPLKDKPEKKFNRKKIGDLAENFLEMCTKGLSYAKISIPYVLNALIKILSDEWGNIKEAVEEKGPKIFKAGTILAGAGFLMETVITISYFVVTFGHAVGIGKKDAASIDSRIDSMLVEWERTEPALPTVSPIPQPSKYELQAHRHNSEDNFLLGNLVFPDNYNKWLKLNRDEIASLDEIEISEFINSNNDNVIQVLCKNLSTNSLNSLVLRFNEFSKDNPTSVADAVRCATIITLFAKELNRRPKVTEKEEQDNGNTHHKKSESPSFHRRKLEFDVKKFSRQDIVPIFKTDLITQVRPCNESYSGKRAEEKSLKAPREVS